MEQEWKATPAQRGRELTSTFKNQTIMRTKKSNQQYRPNGGANGDAGITREMVTALAAAKGDLLRHLPCQIGDLASDYEIGGITYRLIEERGKSMRLSTLSPARHLAEGRKVVYDYLSQLSASPSPTKGKVVVFRP